MSGPLATLNTASTALRALDYALSVTQNNVSNASTPGYAKQTVSLEALPLSMSSGLMGGVVAGNTQTTRDQYLEQAVWLQQEQLGSANAQAQTLPNIESVLTIDGSTGLSGSLNSLFQSFSAWAANPNQTLNAQAVLTQAQDLAQSFQAAASTLASSTTAINGNIATAVDQINTLASQIATLNSQRAAVSGSGLDTSLYDKLESLSKLANITAQVQPDGTVTVLLDGQSPLVIGNQTYALQTGFSNPPGSPNPNATPAAQILDASGQDITNLVTSGTLGGLLQVRNQVLPSLQGDGQQPGALNVLAKQLADRVNTLLQSGQTSSGQPGIPLFTYDSSNITNVANSLALNPNATVTTLAPVNPGPPPMANGIAQSLADLGTSTNPADQINGSTILDYYAQTAAQVGQTVSSANNAQSTATSQLAQAQGLRTSVSGVSLDEEAVKLMQYQRGYQAASKLISVMDSLVQTLLDMVPQ